MPSASVLGVSLIVFTSFAGPMQDRERTVLQVNKPNNAAAATVAPRPAPSPAALLAAARVYYITSPASDFDVARLEARVIESRKFRDFGLRLTRDPGQADAIVEVSASESGNTLTYVVIDARTRTVIGAGKESAIFGLAPKQLARELLGKIEKARGRR